MDEECVPGSTDPSPGLHMPSAFDLDFDFRPIHNATQMFNSPPLHGRESAQESATDYLERSEHNKTKSESVPVLNISSSPQFDFESSQSGQNIVDNGLTFLQTSRGIYDNQREMEIYDRFWSNPQSSSAVAKTGIPTRRKGADHSDDASPLSKKARMSLFGGPVEEFEDARDAIEDQVENGQSKVSENGAELCIASFGLDEPELQRSPSEEPFNDGFGIKLSETDDPSKPSPAPCEQSVMIPPDNQPSYELRQNIERKKTFTYIDTDMSGNFDPSEEAKQKMLKLAKAKAAKATQLRKKSGKQRAPMQHVMKLIVRLPFRDFGNVRNCTNDEENWPENWSEIDSECERTKKETHEFFRSNTPGRNMQKLIEDPRGEVDDLTGRPVARGCKSCRKKDKHDCSMIRDGVYPCSQCDNEDADCEPIIPAAVKARCKQCIADEEVCSFEVEPGQAVCRQCVEGEFVCEALPPEGYCAGRIRLDELVYGENRPFLACTVCRQEKKRCSLKSKTDKPPCKNCAKHQIGCTFFDLAKSEPEKKVANSRGRKRPGPTNETMSFHPYYTAEDVADMMMEEEEEVEVTREVTPEVEMEDAAGNRGILTKINTSFGHPIEFNLATENLDCNFCEMPFFGFVGHFERSVHIIKWHNGLGYTELGGGHCEDKGVTQMCEACTITRLQIMVCPGHEFQFVLEEGTAEDFESASDGLISVEPGSAAMQVELQRWCSLCFSVAKFKCSTAQPSLCDEEGSDTTSLVGCGLRLCERCEFRLRDEFQGDVSLIASAMDMLPKVSITDEDTERLMGRVRADVGFLTDEGLLLKNANTDE